jgi:hypothetical protein
MREIRRLAGISEAAEESMDYSEIIDDVKSMRSLLKRKLKETSRAGGLVTPKRVAAHKKYVKACKQTLAGLEALWDALGDVEDAV